MAWTGRKSVRIIGGLIFTALILIAAVKIFLPAEKIRDLALDQARQKLGREVSVGQVNVSLKGGLGVRLSDFVIPSPDGFSGDPFFYTRTLDLKLEIPPLLHGEIRVNRLVIDSPRLNLVRSADGSSNFDFPSEAGNSSSDAVSENDHREEEAPPPLSIAGLSLNDGQISFRDLAAENPSLQQLTLTGLELSMALTDPETNVYQASGKMSAETIRIEGPPGIPQLDAAIDFVVSWNTALSRLNIVRARISVLELPLSVDGVITTKGQFPEGRLKVILKDQALTGLIPLLPEEIASRVSDSSAGALVNSALDLELTGDIDRPFAGSGKMSFSKVDLAMAQRFLPPEQKGRLSGQCDLDVTFSDLTNNPDTIQYQGVFKANAAAYTESGLVDELKSLDGTLKFDNDQFSITSCKARFASGTFFLTGTLSNPFPYFLPPEMKKNKAVKIPHLVFDLHSPRLDVDRLLPAASPGASAERSGKKPGKNTIGDNQEFPELTCQGTFAADSLIYMQIPLTAVTGKVDLKQRLLRVHQVKGEVYEGQVQGDVVIDLNNLDDPQYSGHYQAVAIEVNHFMTRFSNLAGVLFGSCNLRGEFNTHGMDPDVIRNSLTLDSDAGLSNGRIATSGNVHQTLARLAAQTGQTLQPEQRLSELTTHIKVVNGRVGLDEVSTRLGQFGDLSLIGSYTFSGELDFHGRIHLTEEETSRMFNHGGLLGELNNLLGEHRPERIALPFTVDGSRSDPRAEIDFSSVVKDLQNRVVEEQGQNLEDEVKNKLNDLMKKWK